MSGHWKLWHDMRGRFFVALLVVGWQIYSTSGTVSMDNRMFRARQTNHPTACRPAQPGEMTTQARIQQLLTQGAIAGPLQGQGFRAAANDARLQSTYCALNQRPTEAYARVAARWVGLYKDTMWFGIMPLLMLFMGILIAVGPPFSGESAEASTLTFSLPWSRARWLKEKVVMCGGLMTLLIVPTFVAGSFATHFQGMDLVSQRYLVGDLSVYDALPTLLAGFVGIALGITATMLTRNALAGAVCATMSAYVLTMVDFGRFVGSPYMEGFVLVDVTQAGGVFMALSVIAGAIILTYVRLTRTDF